MLIPIVLAGAGVDFAPAGSGVLVNSFPASGEHDTVLVFELGDG